MDLFLHGGRNLSPIRPHQTTFSANPSGDGIVLAPPSQHPNVVLAALLLPLLALFKPPQAGPKVHSQGSRLQFGARTEARDVLSGGSKFAQSLSHGIDAHGQFGLFLSRLPLLTQKTLELAVRFNGQAM